VTAVRVLALSGSLRRGSYNTALLGRRPSWRRPASSSICTAGCGSVPPFDEDQENVTRRRQSPNCARRSLPPDALLVATPEYNFSIPGQLKNAIDWLSRPAGASALRGKPAVVVGASTGMFGAVWAQAEVRKVLGATGARVIDTELAVRAAHEAFDRSGRLREPGFEARSLQRSSPRSAARRASATAGLLPST
jgi:chromate reductase